MSDMGAAQIIAIVAWGSVVAAPWAAWLLREPLRSPYVIAVIATAALVGSMAGLYHQGQATMVRQDALAAVEREMARQASRGQASRRLDVPEFDAAQGEKPGRRGNGE